jgi:hypothetical protein
MTTDDRRALLLAFVEWLNGLLRERQKYPQDETTVDAFLSQYLPPVPATVATSSQSGEDGQVVDGNVKP